MSNPAPPWYVWFDGVGGAALIAISGLLLRRFWRKSHRTAEKQQSLVMKETVGSAALSGPIKDSQVAAGSNITQTSVIHHHYSPDKPEPELTLTLPDPLSILQSLDNLTPYDLNHAREKFVGLRVLWRITLSKVFKEGDGRWAIAGIFRVEPSYRSPIVIFYLSSVPPELKVAQRETPIWVRGAVKYVADSSSICLEDNPELLRIEHLSG